MADVSVRDYKDVDLEKGTLIVSIPHLGFANLLLTDYLLAELAMDQVACVDSEDFPPLAVLRDGKPRFPVRIHADARSRVAVLRCEISANPLTARRIAIAALQWAKAKRLGRIVAIDGLPVADVDAPPVLAATNTEDARRLLRGAGLVELKEGVITGAPAILLLEGRLMNMNVWTLLISFNDPLEEAQRLGLSADALCKIVPSLHIDAKRLEAARSHIETEVRQLRNEAEAAVRQLERSDRAPEPMYG